MNAISIMNDTGWRARARIVVCAILAVLAALLVRSTPAHAERIQALQYANELVVSLRGIATEAERAARIEARRGESTRADAYTALATSAAQMGNDVNMRVATPLRNGSDMANVRLSVQRMAPDIASVVTASEAIQRRPSAMIQFTQRSTVLYRRLRIEMDLPDIGTW